MKYLVSVALFITLSAGHLPAQSRPYNIVFDLTTGDTATHQRIIRWSKGIMESHPDAKIEIVFYGRALDMVVKGSSTVAADVIKLAAEKKVTCHAGF
jgi:uncharacterized protein